MARSPNLWGGAKLVDLSHYNEYVGWWAESGKALAPEDWALARAINSGETSQYEIIEIQCFDGSRKTILNSASAIRDQNNKIIGAVDVMQDITSQKQVEDKLNLR
jgi:PAS domain-containing protein